MQQLWKYFNYFCFPLIKHSNCAFSANNWYIWTLSDKSKSMHGESSQVKKGYNRNEMNRYINIKDEWDIVYCSKTKGHTYIHQEKGSAFDVFDARFDELKWITIADDFTSFVREKRGFFRFAICLGGCDELFSIFVSLF